MWADVPDKYLNVTSGEEVKLSCHILPSAIRPTNVTWVYTEILDHGLPRNFYIYVNGHIEKEVRQRFNIHNASGSDYSLKIQNIKDFDQGRYHCYNQRQLINGYLISVNGEYWVDTFSSIYFFTMIFIMYWIAVHSVIDLLSKYEGRSESS